MVFKINKMNTSVTLKDISTPRLTISKNEIRIKLPQHQPQEEAEAQLAFFAEVVKEIGPVDFTLRGKIFQGALVMQRDNKTTYKSFNYPQTNLV